MDIPTDPMKAHDLVRRFPTRFAFFRQSDGESAEPVNEVVPAVGWFTVVKVSEHNGVPFLAICTYNAEGELHQIEHAVVKELPQQGRWPEEGPLYSPAYKPELQELVRKHAELEAEVAAIRQVHGHGSDQEALVVARMEAFERSLVPYDRNVLRREALLRQAKRIVTA